MILLQMNFGYPKEAMGDALTENGRGLAESINQEPGFISKVWIENAETEESGGIYMFDTLENAKNYAKMHVERAKSIGATNIEIKYFNVNEPLSKLNRGI